MNKKHRKTLEAIFENPVRSNIAWRDIESLFKAFGCQISEGGKTSGSRVRVHREGQIAVFHRPHPHKETDKGAVKSVRRFLENLGEAP